jgi:hypothetical protein
MRGASFLSPTRTRRGRGSWVLLALSLVAGALVLPHHSTYAQTTSINPALFRLPDSEFPGGSSPTVHQVETNDLLANEGGIVHYGPSFVDEGRITGYFEGASQVVTAGGATYAIANYYLVSIFATAAQSGAAFAAQQSGYQILSRNRTTGVQSSFPTGVGDPDRAALYTVTPASGSVVRSELFFATGPAFVEVYQTYGVQYPNVSVAANAQAHLATDLDSIARNLAPLPGASATPTPRSQPSATGTPVVVPTDAPPASPEPTSTGTQETVIQVSGGTPVAGCGSDYYACATPTPIALPSFTNFVVRAERMGATSTDSQHNASLRSVNIGTTVNLVVYFTPRNVPAGARAVTQFRIQRGYGVRYFHQTVTPLSDTAKTYRITAPYQPSAVGIDALVARVSINGVSHQASTHIAIVRSPSATSSSPPTSGSNSSPGAVAFGLPASVFPTGSQIRTSHVESNAAVQTALVPHLGSQSLASIGRVTGYYMDTVQPNGGHAIYTEYLVSIFSTPAQASAAFNQQHAGYVKLTHAMPGHYTSPISHRGIGALEGFGTSLLTVGGKPFYTREQYFARGRVFAQVVQSYFVRDSRPYGRNARAAFFAIAQKLDAMARGALPTQRHTAKSNGSSTLPTTFGVEAGVAPNPVSYGQQAELRAQTVKGATCTATVEYSTGRAPVSFDGSPRRADPQGVVTWSWHMESKGSSGTAQVNCTAGNRQGSATAAFRIA